MWDLCHSAYPCSYKFGKYITSNLFHGLVALCSRVNLARLGQRVVSEPRAYAERQGAVLFVHSRLVYITSCPMDFFDSFDSGL